MVQKAPCTQTTIVLDRELSLVNEQYLRTLNQISRSEVSSNPKSHQTKYQREIEGNGKSWKVMDRPLFKDSLPKKGWHCPLVSGCVRLDPQRVIELWKDPLSHPSISYPKTIFFISPWSKFACHCLNIPKRHLAAQALRKRCASAGAAGVWPCGLLKLQQSLGPNKTNSPQDSIQIDQKATFRKPFQVRGAAKGNPALM